MQSTSWAGGLEFTGDDDRLIGLAGALPMRLLAEPGLAPGRLAEGAGEVGLPMPQNGDLRRTSNDHTTSTSQDFLPAQN